MDAVEYENKNVIPVNKSLVRAIIILVTVLVVLNLFMLGFLIIRSRKGPTSPQMPVANSENGEELSTVESNESVEIPSVHLEESADSEEESQETTEIVPTEGEVSNQSSKGTVSSTRNKQFADYFACLKRYGLTVPSEEYLIKKVKFVHATPKKDYLVYSPVTFKMPSTYKFKQECIRTKDGCVTKIVIMSVSGNKLVMHGETDPASVHPWKPKHIDADKIKKVGKVLIGYSCMADDLFRMDLNGKIYFTNDIEFKKDKLSGVEPPTYLTPSIVASSGSYIYVYAECKTDKEKCTNEFLPIVNGFWLEGVAGKAE